MSQRVQIVNSLKVLTLVRACNEVEMLLRFAACFKTSFKNCQNTDSELHIICEPHFIFVLNRNHLMKASFFPKIINPIGIATGISFSWRMRNAHLNRVWILILLFLGADVIPKF